MSLKFASTVITSLTRRSKSHAAHVWPGNPFNSHSVGESPTAPRIRLWNAHAEGHGHSADADAETKKKYRYSFNFRDEADKVVKVQTCSVANLNVFWLTAKRFRIANWTQKSTPSVSKTCSGANACAITRILSMVWEPDHHRNGCQAGSTPSNRKPKHEPMLCSNAPKRKWKWDRVNKSVSFELFHRHRQLLSLNAIRGSTPGEQDAKWSFQCIWHDPARHRRMSYDAARKERNEICSQQCLNFKINRCCEGSSVPAQEQFFYQPMAAWPSHRGPGLRWSHCQKSCLSTSSFHIGKKSRQLSWKLLKQLHQFIYLCANVYI